MLESTVNFSFPAIAGEEGNAKHPVDICRNGSQELRAIC